MDLTPITREEVYLSAAAGNDVELPEPITRTDHFLLAVAQSGGGGGGEGGTTNYTLLTNKPQINGVTLTGNKTGAAFGLVDAEQGKGLSTNDFTTDEKSKLANIEAEAQVNVIEGVSANGTAVTVTNKIADVTVPTKTSDLQNDSGYQTSAQVSSSISSALADYTPSTQITSALALKADKTGGYEQLTDKPQINGVTLTGNKTTEQLGIVIPGKTSDLTNDSDYQTGDEVEDTINTKLSSTYKAGGSSTFAGLPTLTEANLGLVMNLTEDFTTTADFVEGAGKTYPAGTNVVIALVGLAYKYDVLAGFVDLSDYVQTSVLNTALAGKVDKEDGKGLSANDYTDVEKTKLAGIEAGAEVNPDVATEQTDGLMAAADKREIALLRELIAGVEAPIYRTASANPFRVSDGYASAAVKALSVEIQPVQSGSGDPSPDNVRPISGWSGIHVWRMGHNLLSSAWEVGSINGSGQNSANTVCIRCAELIPVFPNTIYDFKLDDDGATDTWANYYSTEAGFANIETTSSTHLNRVNLTGRTSFQTPAACRYVRLRFAPSNGMHLTREVSLVWHGADSAYVPNDTQTVTISTGDAGTVYGGTLDVATGRLSVTHKRVELSTLAGWNAFSQNKNMFFTGISDMWLDPIKVDTRRYGEAISNCLEFVRTTPYPDSHPYAFSLWYDESYSGYRIFVSAPNCASLDAFLQWIDDAGVYIVYRLASPVTHQLTAQSLTTLDGENSVWSDAGPVDVTYRANPALSVNV